MIIKKDIFYKAFLIILFFIPRLSGSFELIMIMCFFLLGFLLLDVKFKFSNLLVNSIIPLSLIVLLAGISGFFYTSESYDVLKDFLYLAKPVIMITLGYYLIGKIRDKKFIFKAILFVGVFFAIYHIYRVSNYLLGFQFVIAKIRYVGGNANYIELLALVFLHVRSSLRPVKLKPVLGLVVRLILYASFLLYFSRTMLFAFFILLLAINGYAKLSRRGVIYVSVIVGLVVVMFGALQTMDLDRKSLGFEGFLYKLKNAPSEILITKIDTDNHAELWDHWRGYEAYQAVEQLGKIKNNAGFFFGKGLGSLVDLGFYAPLNQDTIRYIPILHNGFAYLLFKSGVFGIFLHLLFLLGLYLLTYQRQINASISFFNNSIAGFSLFYFFTTLTITGIYNQGDVLAVVLGAFIYLRHFHRKKALEE